MKILICILAVLLSSCAHHEPELADATRKHLTSLGKSPSYVDGFVDGNSDGIALVAREPSVRLYKPHRYSIEAEYKAGYDNGLNVWRKTLSDFDHPEAKALFPSI